MADSLAGLEKSDAIRKVVSRAVASGWWQSQAEKDACCWLGRHERDRRSDVTRFVAEQYEQAGLDSRGAKR